MDVKRVTKKIRLDSEQTAIRYQLFNELVFLRKIPLIESDLQYLTYLVQWGPIALKDFCKRVVLEIYGAEIATDVEKHPMRVQSIRNRLGLLQKKGLVVKDGKNKKTISFNPSIEIVRGGNVLLEYNFLYIETKKDQRPAAVTG